MNPRAFVHRPAIVVLAAILAAPAQAGNQALLQLFELLRDKGSITAVEYEMLVKTAQAEDLPPQ
jgi:hypothetical protein